MSTPFRFHEILFDYSLFSRAGENSALSGFGEWANTVVKNERTGAYKTNVNRPFFLEMMTLDLTLVRASPDNLAYFLKFYHGGFGSGIGFRCRATWDYKATGEVIGTIGTSQTKTFSLIKSYIRPGATDYAPFRYITKPVVNATLASGSVTLYKPDGVTARTPEVAFAVTVGGASSGFTYSIKNTTGELTVTTTSASGAVAWSGEHDVPCAFVGNSQSHKSIGDNLSRISQVQIREVPYLELGIPIH